MEVCLNGLTHRQTTEERGGEGVWRGGPPDLSRISWFLGGSELTRLLTEVTTQAQPQKQVWLRGRNPRIAGLGLWWVEVCLTAEVELWKTA